MAQQSLSEFIPGGIFNNDLSSQMSKNSKSSFGLNLTSPEASIGVESSSNIISESEEEWCCISRGTVDAKLVITNAPPEGSRTPPKEMCYSITFDFEGESECHVGLVKCKGKTWFNLGLNYTSCAMEVANLKKISTGTMYTHYGATDSMPSVAKGSDVMMGPCCKPGKDEQGNTLACPPAKTSQTRVVTGCIKSDRGDWVDEHLAGDGLMGATREAEFAMYKKAFGPLRPTKMGGEGTDPFTIKDCCT
tara:strand:- start:2705 stop:3448 length:744 start_codon:yes stop_codon:yes gene_type:complete